MGKPQMSCSVGANTKFAFCNKFFIIKTMCWSYQTSLTMNINIY